LLGQNTNAKYHCEQTRLRFQLATLERDKNTLEVYLRQYEQCWQDKRALEAMIWQTPAVFLAIDGVVLAGLMSQGFPFVGATGSVRLVRLATYSVTLLFAAALSAVGTVQLRKHRLFCKARVDDLRWIELNLQRMADYYLVQFKTSAAIQDIARYPDIDRNWIDRQSAYNWLFALSSSVTVLLIVSIVTLLLLALANWI
jgi:hypothetical protein